jgi:limonene-1,2-epoxide hydrolase
VENAVRDFMKELESDRDEARVERILDRMTPDARYRVNAWERPLTGRDEIGAEMLRPTPAVGSFRIEIKAMASSGQTVLVERVDWMTIGEDQRSFALHTAGVFEVDADGKVAAWRDY